MTQPQKQNYLPEVRNQYENYPYPYRNPEDEKTSFRLTGLDSLSYINHFGFEGRRDYTKGLRVLVAGGGTGDALIVLAEQLRDTPSEVVYLDISTASMAVAKERAKVRGLTNITWTHGSLLDVPTLGVGTFDYINCSGVLHHLKDPDAGLAALASVLRDDGIMGIMLYAPYGRAGIYQMQAIMRLLNRDEPDMQARVENCKPLINELKTEWMKDIHKRFTDIANFGDVGIYDMFLHSQDRSYSVPEVYEFLEKAGLQLQHFGSDMSKLGNHRYRPEFYVQNPRFLKQLETLSEPEKHALAELMHGSIFKHVFLTGKKKKPLPDVADTDNIPFLAQFIADDAAAKFRDLLKNAPQGTVVPLTLTISGQKRLIGFTNTPHAASFLEYLDGKRTLGEICQCVQGAAKNAPATAQLVEEFKQLYDAFALQDCMFLRHRSVPAFPKTWEIQKRVSEMHGIEVKT